MIVFTVEGRVVGATRSTNQRYIGRLLLKLANTYLGKEVQANYPKEQR